MTPEQALRQAILADETGGARKAKTKVKAEKRAVRERRAASRFVTRMAVRFLMLGLSLGGSALMLFTEQGRTMRGEFQTAVLDVLQTELAARRAAAPDSADVPVQVQAQADPETGSRLPGWFSAGTSDDRSAPSTGKAKVSGMPESRVTIRRMGH